MALWTLYKRELSTYFQSTVAYVVLFGSAIIQGVFFFVLLKIIVDSNFKDESLMQAFFTVPLFFWLLLLGQVPLITMRVFSEEFKLGTIEMLLTAPVREWDVVLAKYFGALTFFMVLWSPVALDFLAVQMFSSPPPPVYWSEIGLTALTILLGGGFYVSLGVFTSVLSKNQIISAVLCFAALLFFFSLSFGRWFEHMDPTTLAWISYVSLPEHLQNAVIGLFDTRPLVFYITSSLFVLILTKTILEGRRLRG